MCSNMSGSGRRSRRLRCTPVCAPALPARPLAELASPRYSSAESRVARPASRENAARQIEIAIPVQSQDLLHRRQRHPLGGRLSPPPVEQPVIAVLFVALVPAPHRPIADADNLGCLPPGRLFE